MYLDRPCVGELFIKAVVLTTLIVNFLLFLGHSNLDLKWRSVRKRYDHRDNAAIIVECSNVTPFKWKSGCFICAVCSLSSADFDVIKGHMLTKPHKAGSVTNSRNKIFLKVEVTDLKCELCSKEMPDVEELFEHLIEKHDRPLIREYGIGVMPFLLTGPEYSCIKCDETFKHFTNLNRHVNIHYPNTICPLCGKPFADSNRMDAHMKIHETDANELFKCPRCDEKFPTRYEKNKHVAKHNTLKHRCPYCSEAFKSYSSKLNHLKDFHDKKIKYPCNFCSAVFGMCNQRTKHIRQVHIKEKTFACELCPYAFVTHSQLRAHMVRHGGERKYQCQICKKAYARRYTLREHMRIHENDKRFTCLYCNNAFVQKCSLKSHLKTHHPN